MTSLLRKKEKYDRKEKLLKVKQLVYSQHISNILLLQEIFTSKKKYIEKNHVC